MKAVLITWIDSKSGPPGWEYVNDLEPLEPIICRSIGFLVDETENHKTLVSTMGGDQCLGRITIPNQSIIGVKLITTWDQDQKAVLGPL